MKIVVCGALIVLGAASPAIAQSARPPKLSVAVAAGRVNPVSLELPLTAPVWTISVQFAPAKHLIIEGVATGWRFSQHLPTIAGDIDRVSSHTIGVMAVATAATGRWRWSSGAGVGIDAFTLDAFGGRGSTRELSAEIGLGVDYRIDKRLAAFVSYRQTQPFAAALGVVNVSGGLRIAVHNRP